MGQANGGGGSAYLGTPNSLAGTRAYAFYFTRFIVSPSYDQLQPFSSSFFGAAAYDLSPSFDLFTPAMLQAGSSKIAFASNREGRVQIYLMNADGTGQLRLTNNGGNDDNPRFSPNGAKILFQSDRDNPATGYNDIYVMNADGTGQTRLTDAPGNDDSPYWSPDGTKIVFRSDRERDCCDPTSQVWVMNADGTGLVNLSGNQYGDYSSSWTSSGGNQPPVANAGDSYSGITGQSTVFNGGGSFDPDGSIASYSWNFGDGTTGSGVSPTHAYATPGSYTVTLTVTDNLSAQASATATASVSSSSGDQYTASFLQWGLARQPSGDEGLYWADIMRAAYPRGQTSMLIAMRELGMTVFESSEYAARNRSDHWYVYDLYKTYLMRDPDAGGWAFWESNLPSMGRESLRRAFDESGEFQSIVATLTASGAPSSAASSLATARVDPFNQTGDQLRARDCEWGVGLLSLPGRAGLDLGLGLSYSSLVWTRSGPYAYFDEDRGSPSPGFRLGFATIQGPQFDAKVGGNVYMLVTSSGRRVSLRQVGTSNVYEAADSSYLQLIVGATLLVRSTDGTQMSYSKFGDEWRATLIEDRNGNFISAAYDWRGDLTSVADTLGRVITFNYDANANLSTITQSRQVNGVAQTHVWASFGWGAMSLQPAASGLAAVGMYSGESIPVLRQAGLGDGSRYTFEYTGAGQVNVIRRFTSDNVERSRITYDYATPADDGPRVTAMRVWADNWTGMNGVPSEVVTQLSDPGDGSHEMTLPDGTEHKEIYGTGWQKGLVTQSEVRSGGALQKQTVTQWTQDDTAVGYQTNPRVIETNIYDFPVDAPSNRRRTTVDYGQYAQYGLPHLVTEYASDGVTALRQSYTDYNVSQPYLDRRIIGLVSSSRVYDPVAVLWQAKTTFAYDNPANLSSQATSAVGHDQTYNTSFLTRGNVTSVSRWDVTDIGNAAKTLTSQVSYDAAGSTLSSADPLGHQTSIAYADSFSDLNNSRGTFAYPTTVTDADGFSSSMQYNFDFGARTRLQGPPPAGQPSGIIQTIAYDTAARVEWVTTENNGAYTRYLYGPNYVGTLSSVNTVADEAYSVQTFDGMGRTLIAASNNPGGGGAYRAQSTKYDLMGRAVKRSNPADVNSAWSPVGPDDGAGWLYTQQSYDWKGRPEITTNTDGTQSSASYEGCGCAGGEVVTVTDEAGRQQKVYSDALGRQWKSEVLNWEGSVYSTTTSTFNARDQVTLARRYQGTDQSSVFQQEAMTYDGYGRLQSRHVPEQNAGTATVYAYNADDTVQSVTDARGARANYSYNNNRHLPTGITYDPVAGIDDPPDVTFSYDAAGNRLTMTTAGGAGGSVAYTYDMLSRLESEARQFPGLSGTYALSYEYTLSGQLKKMKDETSPSSPVTFTYGYDTAGQLTEVTGTPYGGAQVSTYASEIKRRAFGSLKSVKYGNNLVTSLGYDERLRVSGFEVAGRPAQFGSPVVMSSAYQYHADSGIKFAKDGLDDRFDRAYSFDHAGRLKEAYTGTQARDYVNNTVVGTEDGPYRQTYSHDVWDNLTQRTTRFWSQSDAYGANIEAATNRNTGWVYDADGRVTGDHDLQYKYDAAGRTRETANASQIITQQHDGDGQTVKRVKGSVASYYVRSSVLGGRVVTELNGAGGKAKSYVYAGGQVIAEQVSNQSGQTVVWRHANPVTGSQGESGQEGGYQTTMEADPTGVNVGMEDPFTGLGGGPIDPEIPSLFNNGGGCSSSDPNCRTCTLDGFAMDCERVGSLLANGAAVFETQATVRITYTSGRPPQIVTGTVNLPSGLDVRFTGQQAQDAAAWFGIGMSYNIGLTASIGLAVGGAMRTQSAGAVDRGSGSSPNLSSPFVNFFVSPQSSALADRAADTERTNNACRDMAAKAQEIMNNLHGSMGSVLKRFDKEFTTLYAGRPATSLLTAGRQFLNRGAGATIDPYYKGQTGFRSEFREMDSKGNPAPGFHDQTHHFAFYLSMGINENGSGALAVAQRLHRAQDNEGDARLGKVAYNIGRGLLSDPIGINRIGETIQSAVCGP